MVLEVVERLDAAGYPNMVPAYHPIFEHIDRAGTRLTELAARADMTHQSMGELVAGLEQRGFLERRPDPRDRRARLVCLTEAGLQLLQAGNRELDAIDAKWTERFRSAGLEGDLGLALRRALEEEG